MDPEREPSDFAVPGDAASPPEPEQQTDAESFFRGRVLAPETIEPSGAPGVPEAVEPELQRSADESERQPEEPSPADTLSPAVRRLVRQYELDITGIHGTGPSGRIRVGDVIGMLGARTDASSRLEGAARSALVDGEPRRERDDAAERPFPSAASAVAPGNNTQPVTTVFECDLSRVVSHRKRLRQSGADVLLTSYCLVACVDALRAVPDIVATKREAAPEPRFGVLLSAADDEARSTLVDSVIAAGSVDDRLLAFDRALRASSGDDLAGADLMIHHYGLTGSLLATPLPLGADQTASVGIGRVRRQIAVKSTDGEESPRVAAVCYVTLTFAPDRITLHRANRFVAHVVRGLEHWPE